MKNKKYNEQKLSPLTIFLTFVFISIFIYDSILNHQEWDTAIKEGRVRVTSGKVVEIDGQFMTVVFIGENGDTLTRFRRGVTQKEGAEVEVRYIIDNPSHFIVLPK
jgi:hypothetical protein